MMFTAVRMNAGFVLSLESLNQLLTQDTKYLLFIVNAKILTKALKNLKAIAINSVSRFCL